MSASGDSLPGGLPDRSLRARLASVPVDVLLGGAVLLLTTYWAWLRLYYGVALTDEAFYAVVTQRFALGDRPYVDEINLRQTAELLTVPLYWLYLKIVGSTDGVILFLRYQYFALQLIVAAFAYRTTRRLSGTSYGLVAAALPLAFMPGAIPATNYNTLGSLLFALGLLLGLPRAFQPGRARGLVAAGAVHGVACIAYPPLALPVGVVAIATLFAPRSSDSKRRFGPTIAYVGGAAAIGVAFLAWAGPNLIEGMPLAMRYEAMLTRPRRWKKVVEIATAFATLSPGLYSSAVTLLASWLIVRRWPSARILVPFFLIGPLAYWLLPLRPEHYGINFYHVRTLHFAIYFGVLTGFFVFLAERRWALPFLLGAWLPAVGAGATTAFSSDNAGCMNGGLGLFAAATLLPFAVAWGAERDRPLTARARLPVVAALAVVPLAMTWVNYDCTYWDGPVAKQTELVKIGPFKGLYGTPYKRDLAHLLTTEIRALAPAGERMLAYYNIPAAYLSVPTRPAVQTSWTDSRMIIPPFLPYYDEKRSGRGIVVVGANQHGTSRHLEALVEDPTRLLRDVGHFRIYREPPPPPRR